MVVEAVQYGLPKLPLFWCALVPLAVLTAVWSNLRLSCVTLVVVVLIPSAGPAFERPLDRVFGILVGVISSIIVSTVIRTTSPQS
jgi:hypothetical protein